MEPAKIRVQREGLAGVEGHVLVNLLKSSVCVSVCACAAALPLIAAWVQKRGFPGARR